LKAAKESFSPNVKICRVYVGLMTELSIGPWIGMDTKNGKYEALGSADTSVTFTGLGDIGRALAQLASMPTEKIPDQIRICGDGLSFREIASNMSAASGSDIQVTEESLQGFKKEIVGKGDTAQYLRFLMGEGKVNFGKGGIGNDNDLINPRPTGGRGVINLEFGSNLHWALLAVMDGRKTTIFAMISPNSEPPADTAVHRLPSRTCFINTFAQNIHKLRSPI
jgi:hypothetical protein